ncbi:hypothetical protein C2845_PM16G06480 [Panicum miliaceum]|uniref:Bifunctional inhibitor/plant lipid transfer protein/seed storage helical domain-containing protein n=1 Tax=Panicum miliaceum TaxID=4540 RepID=A0A3L6PWJ2_PANMI|nr:hypothetical protein C2845_PM16G06480 [Panicum miliaceum]
MAPSSKTKLAALLMALAALSMAAAQVPPPPPAPSSSGNGTCEPLKLRVCGGLLSGLLGGLLPGAGGDGGQCCPLLGGLVDLDAAACVCAALRANVLGVNLNVPFALDRLLNTCGRDVPTGFTCPPPA